MRPYDRLPLKQKLLRQQAHMDAWVHSSVLRHALRVGREAATLHFGGC